jgi:hypothetical protein
VSIGCRGRWDRGLDFLQLKSRVSCKENRDAHYDARNDDFSATFNADFQECSSGEISRWRTRHPYRLA